MINFIKRYSAVTGVIFIFSAIFLYTISPANEVYYMILGSIGIFFIIVSILLNIKVIKGLFNKRAAKHGTNTAVMTIMFLMILIFINFLSFRNFKRFDLTEEGEFTISPQTKRVLKGLDKKVKLRAYFDEGNPNKVKLKDLISSYEYESKNIQIEFIDPDKSPGQAQRDKIKTYETTIFESGDQSSRIKGVSEAEITNAIISVSRSEKKTICFLEGHGEHSIEDSEKDGYNLAKEAVKDQGYNLKQILLLKEGSVPSDCHELIIGGPKKPFFENEIIAVKEYFNNGGALFTMIDPEAPSEFKVFLEGLGAVIGDDLIIDTISRLFGGDYTVPVVTEYGDHEITREFNFPTFFPMARSVSPAKRDGFEISDLLKTSENSWAESDTNSREVRFDEKDTKGPVSLGIVIAKQVKTETKDSNPEDADKTDNMEKGGTAVVFGDSDFASNNYFNFSGNGDLFMNSLNWLVKEDDLIAIRPKKAKSTPIQLTSTQGNLIFSLSVIIVPAIVLITGISRWWRRRKL